MKDYRFILSVVCLVILGSLGYLWRGGLLRPHSSNIENRRAMVEVRDHLVIGDSVENVTAKLRKFGDGSELELVSYSGACWMIRMPGEIATTDWRIYLGFGDERVKSIKIRTSDGPWDSESPPDVGELHACGL